MEAINEAEEIVHPMDMRSMMIIKALKNMTEISNTSYWCFNIYSNEQKKKLIKVIKEEK